MKYANDYERYNFITLDDYSNKNTFDEIEKINKRIHVFEFFSGIQKLYAEYNYYTQAYYDILDLQKRIIGYEDYFSDYLEELELKKREYIIKIEEIEKKLVELNDIEEELMNGKKLIIIKH